LKKKVVLIVLLILIACITVITIIFLDNKRVKNDIKLVSKEFEIYKIKYYSSANAISNTTNYQNPEWNLKVYQYTDIAIYINRINEESANNYITRLCLSNFNSENMKVYYLNPQNFGNSNLNTDDIIEDKLEYNVINSGNNEDAQGYNIPIYFQDCSNPITIRVVNLLADNYRVSKDTALNYNGKLIRDLGFGLYNLNDEISFDLEMDTKLGKSKTTRVELTIPFENEKNSILDGDFESDEKVDTKIEIISNSTSQMDMPKILSNKNSVDIENIIDKNRNINMREEMIYEEQDLEYTTQYLDNENLPSGTIHVSQIGITGKQDVITIKKYNENELISEQIVASNVKKAPINKVVELGIGKRKK